jgi:hypothetical protein
MKKHFKCVFVKFQAEQVFFKIKLNKAIMSKEWGQGTPEL